MGGGPAPPPGGGNGGTGGNGTDNSVIIDLLRQILEVLKGVFTINFSEPQIDVITLTTGAAFERMYDNPRKVKSAVIQNISTEDVTLQIGSGTSSTPAFTAGDGILLNAASASGKGGGSLPVGNIDLSKFYFVRTTSGDTLAVYVEL